jgi:signal transduction histidine kinase
LTPPRDFYIPKARGFFVQNGGHDNESAGGFESPCGRTAMAEDNAKLCGTTLSYTERKLHSLLELGRLIGLDLKIDDMLLRIAEKATEVMEADRFTIFLYDPVTDELWSKVALGMGNAEIRVPVGSGIAGHSFKSGETVNLKDAYSDPRFFKSVDDRTGYHTKTLLSMPFYGRSGQPIGVIQLLNKKEGVFNNEDETFLRTFNNHAAVFIEMAQLQKARIDVLEQAREEAERLSRAKGKALDHLSHELRTPLSLIQGTLKILRRKVAKQASSMETESSFASLERNVARLSGIQKETDKILRSHRELEWGFLIDELERFLRRMEDVSKVPPDIVDHLNGLKIWILHELERRQETLQSRRLWDFISQRVQIAKERSISRAVSIDMEGELTLVASIEPRIFREVIDGILKNSIENTPDGGSIAVQIHADGDRTVISVSDTGVGITEENMAHIFDGLFHAQDTDMYGSKKPYDFNAGGKGLDLLLVRIYARRYGFSLDVISTRCAHIPTDRDLCPGDITQCSFCDSAAECMASGGTRFQIALPVTCEGLSAGRGKPEALGKNGGE